MDRYEQALKNGVQDKSYSTVRYGHVAAYSGEAIVTDEDGKLYKAIGVGTRGSAEFLDREGFIKFLPMHTTPKDLTDLVNRRNETLQLIDKMQDMVLATADNKYLLALHAIIEDLRKVYKALKEQIKVVEAAMNAETSHA